MIDLLTDKCQICIFHVYLNFIFFAANLNVDYIDKLSTGEDNLFTTSDFQFKAIGLSHNHYLLANSDIFHYRALEENSSIPYI